MGTVSTLPRPKFKGVEVSANSVSAKGVDANVTNGCVFIKLDDETMLKAFVSGLEAKGVSYDATNLTVRLFIRN